jgi:hypothetical protein
MSKLRTHSPWAVTAVGVFLLFGASMAFLAGTTLIWRGSALDRMWVLNAPAYKQLSMFGKAIGAPFLVFSVALLAASLGWFRHRLWGWRLAVAIIATQVFGGAVSIFMGHFMRGAAGVTIAGALLFYLLRPEVRGAFAERRAIER